MAELFWEGSGGFGSFETESLYITQVNLEHGILIPQPAKLVGLQVCARASLYIKEALFQ
jgi:hypothetical protein